MDANHRSFSPFPWNLPGSIGTFAGDDGCTIELGIVQSHRDLLRQGVQHDLIRRFKAMTWTPLAVASNFPSFSAVPAAFPTRPPWCLLMAWITPKQLPSKSMIGMANKCRVTYLGGFAITGVTGRRLPRKPNETTCKKARTSVPRYPVSLSWLLRVTNGSRGERMKMEKQEFGKLGRGL